MVDSSYDIAPRPRRERSISEQSNDILTTSLTTSRTNMKRKAETNPKDCGHGTKRVAIQGKSSLSDNFHVRVPGLVYPKSKYLGSRPPLPVIPERLAIRELHDAWFAANQVSSKVAAGFESFTLTGFTIYRPETGWHAGEMASLQDLKSRRGASDFLFDGLLIAGDVRRWVQKVPFNILAVDGYGERTVHDVSDKLYIQSDAANGQDVWYKLDRAAPEYERFFRPFVWLANWTKYAVDYLLETPAVTLGHFQRRFFEWCFTRHGKDYRFHTWFEEFGRKDFRAVAAANVDYLWKEATNIEEKTRRHPLWKEIDGDQLGAVTAQPVVQRNTILTPFVYDCFKNMYFAECLEARTPVEKTTAAWQQQKKSLGLSPGLLDPATSGTMQAAPEMLPVGHKNEFATGDVVGIKRDVQSAWKDKAEIWYAYVQEVHRDHKGRQLLDVIWLYAPADTICSSGYYPYQNELFLSDNCNCGDGKLFASDVICSISITFSPPCLPNDTHFVRQKYRTDDAAFVHLQQSDLKCAHLNPSWKSDLEEVMENYKLGDTVLVEPLADGEDALLEPVEIVEFKLESEEVVVRQLLRRRRDLKDSGARPNELVYTNVEYNLPASKVIRRCHVRCFSADDVQKAKLPVPYNRNGSADCFFISTRLTGEMNDRNLEELRSPNYPTTLIQGVDLSATTKCRPLSGMDLYCGGGNFGRGLEESGAVKNRWSVDWAKKPIHTYRVNQRDPKDSALFHGSVNDYLARAMDGEVSHLIAAIGAAQFLSAGSPCQGFSIAQPNKNSEQSRKNASMVASVAAFIDFYGFEYAILENVVSMASNMGQDKDQNVLAQLVCTLVAQGYQLQLFNLDAWSFGSPQSRSRLFVSIAAPGHELPAHPNLTHSHPEGKWQRSLGKAINGEPFGKRKFDKTPFKFISAQEGVADLPPIGDAAVPICIRFPDHRPSVDLKQPKRHLISAIPRWPRGEGFVSALQSGHMPKGFIEYYARKSQAAYERSSHAWRRIRPDGLLPTIATKQTAACTLTGTLLHWDQHRIITIQEARRAQGFPDDEVLIGSPADQYHVIGNSVARQVALGLGMSLREVWLKNSLNDETSRSLEVPAVTAEEDLVDSESLNGAIELSEETIAIPVKLSQPLLHEQVAQVVVPARSRKITYLSASETVRVSKDERRRSSNTGRTRITLSRTIQITSRSKRNSLTLTTPQRSSTGPMYPDSETDMVSNSDFDTENSNVESETA